MSVPDGDALAVVTSTDTKTRVIYGTSQVHLNFEGNIMRAGS
jgi:hypothetical protein